jgi:hypothetical protein
MMSSEKAICTAITKAGERCKRTAVAGSEYCFMHAEQAGAEGEDGAAQPVVKSTPARPRKSRAKKAADTTVSATAVPAETVISVSNEAVKELVDNANRVADAIRTQSPDYEPPRYTPQGMLALLQSNLEKLIPDITVLQQLKANFEGTKPEDLLDPETWKGLWYTLNYLAQAEARSTLEKLIVQMEKLPGGEGVIGFLRNFEGTTPKDLLDIETWKGAWFILNHTARLQAEELKKKVFGEPKE